jgi:ribA/ribD-fused uncharacterized protein
MALSSAIVLSQRKIMLIKNDKLLFWRNADAYSNWAYTPSFVIDGVEFAYAEQPMMWLKALLFNDMVTAQKILTAKYPWDIKDKEGKVIEYGHKSLGRQVQNFDELVWVAERDSLIDIVTYAKFSQIQDLREGIIASYPLMIVEASPHDRIWGIGLEETDPRAWDEATWPPGVLNLLGKSLMRSRDRIMKDISDINSMPPL